MIYKTLPIEEQQLLCRRYFEERNIADKNKLFNHNMRLIRHVMKSFTYDENISDDLYQEGGIGLLRSIDKFNPNRGVTFATYASFWIRAYIFKFLMNKVPLTKTCTTNSKRKLFFTLSKERAKLLTQSSHVSDQEIADHLGVDVQDVQQISNKNAKYKDIDENIIDEKSSNKMDTYALTTKYLDICQEFKRTLKPKEKFIFERRIENPMHDTLENIGNDLMITRQGVNRIEAKLLSKFRKRLFNNDISREDMESILGCI